MKNYRKPAKLNDQKYKRCGIAHMELRSIAELKNSTESRSTPYPTFSTTEQSQRGMFPSFKHYCTNRLFEWFTTLTMLGMAIEIAIWPQAVGASAFRYIMLVITPENMGVFFLVFGLLRVAALIANGSWPEHGPRMRAMGAGAAALMWGQMGISLLHLGVQPGNVPSPGISLFFFLVIGELVSAYRAISDARPSD